MKLITYLTDRKIKRTDFAAQIGVVPSYVTALCADECWPSKAVAGRIFEATGGAVTPNDFLQPTASEAA